MSWLRLIRSLGQRSTEPRNDDSGRPRTRLDQLAQVTITGCPRMTLGSRSDRGPRNILERPNRDGSACTQKHNSRQLSPSLDILIWDVCISRTERGDYPYNDCDPTCSI